MLVRIEDVETIGSKFMVQDVVHQMIKELKEIAEANIEKYKRDTENIPAAKQKLGFGRYKGLTLGEIVAIEAQPSPKDGERPLSSGLDYLQWVLDKCEHVSLDPERGYNKRLRPSIEEIVRDAKKLKE